MAKIASFEVKQHLRPCLVYTKEKKGAINETSTVHALFHAWAHEAEVIAQSLMRGGHPGGQLSHTFALVEFEDGTVKMVNPERVKFLDNAEKFEEYDWSMNDKEVKNV